MLTFSEIIFRISLLPSVFGWLVTKHNNKLHDIIEKSSNSHSINKSLSQIYNTSINFSVHGTRKKIRQSNLCLLHLWGLRNSGIAGPSLRGFGQRGWSLPLNPSLFVSEPESTKLFFTAK